jgi:hypothetical protein
MAVIARTRLDAAGVRTLRPPTCPASRGPIGHSPSRAGLLSEIHVARDGGLEYIKQHPSGSLPIGGQSCAAMLASMQAQQIGVGRLVAYVNDQEAGNWLGVSYMRRCSGTGCAKTDSSAWMPSTPSATARVSRWPTRRSGAARVGEPSPHSGDPRPNGRHRREVDGRRAQQRHRPRAGTLRRTVPFDHVG